MKKLFIFFISIGIINENIIWGQNIIPFNRSENLDQISKNLLDDGLLFSSHATSIKDYFKNNVNINTYNNLKDDEKKVFLDVLMGLRLNRKEYFNRALDYINFETNKQLADKIFFYLMLTYFQNKDFSAIVKLSDLFSLENFSNQEILILKFIQGYSYLINQQPEKALIYFDVVRQIDKDNIFYADAYYYYSYLQLRINKNFIAALAGFKKITTHPVYSKITPYYIAQLMYELNAPIMTMQYLEDLLSKNNNEFYYQKELKSLLLKIYFDYKKYTKCTELANPALIENDINKFYFGFSYFKLDSINKAIDYLSLIKTSKNDSLLYETNFILAQCFLMQKNKLKAFNYLGYCKNNTLNNWANQDFVVYMYAKLAIDLGQSNIALQVLSEFARQYPKSSFLNDVQQLMFISYSNANNFKDALSIFDSTKNRDKNLLSKIYYGRALDFYYENNMDSVVVFLNKNIDLANRDSFYISAIILLANIFYNNQNFNNVISLLNKDDIIKMWTDPLVRNRDLFQVKYVLIYAYLQSNNYDKAVKIINEVETMGYLPKNYSGDLILRKADCYFMLKQYNLSKDIYESYLKTSFIDKDYALYQLALITGISNSSKKITLLNALIDRYPNSKLYFLVLKEIGTTQLSLNQFDSSIQTLKKIIFNPLGATYWATAYLNIGIAYTNLNLLEEGIGYFKKIIQEFVNSSESEEALFQLKEYYTNKGEIDKYVELVKQYKRNSPEDNLDSLYFSVGEIKYRDKKYDEASKLFETYLKYDSISPKRIHAFYYLLHTSYYNKKYNEALHYADSILLNGENKFSEKTYALLLKIIKIDPTLNTSTKSNQYLLSIYNKTQNALSRAEALTQILEKLYYQNAWKEGEVFIASIKPETNLTDWQKTLILSFKSENKIIDSAFLDAIAINDTLQNLNKGFIGAKYAYKNASIYFQLKDLKQAEKQAFYTINNYSNVDTFMVLSYFLLADIYAEQKDFFNAKATLRSILDNAPQDVFKQMALQKLIFIEDKVTNKKKIDSILNNKNK